MKSFRSWSIPLLLSLVTANAQNKDTLGTLVTAEKSRVTFRWAKNHPWDARFQAGQFILRAEYVDYRGTTVAEAAAIQTARDPKQRTVQLQLIEELKGVPSGPVCLLVQLLTDRGPIPVRKAGTGDSSRFRYEAWDARMSAIATKRLKSLALLPAKVRVQEALASVADVQSVIDKRGWKSPDVCEVLHQPQPEPLIQPYSAVEPDRQEQIARKVCVYRAWNAQKFADSVRMDLRRELPNARHTQANAEYLAKKISRMYATASVLPQVLNELLGESDAKNTVLAEARKPEAAAVLRDWKLFSPTIANYDPHVKNSEGFLLWPGEPQNAAARLYGREVLKQLNAEWAAAALPPANERDNEAVAAAILDAYANCVEECRKNLRLEWTAWESLRASAPQRAETAHAFRVKECRTEFGKLDAAKRLLAERQAALARIEEELRQIPDPAPLPGGAVALNGNACTPARR